MELIGNLKKQTEQTCSKEETGEIIEEAGMKLTDDELETVSGGGAPEIMAYTGEKDPRYQN